MAQTIIRTLVPAGARSPNILANTSFQFADTPGEGGGVAIQVAITSDVAQNQAEIKADKDFVSLDEVLASVNPPILNENPGQQFAVEPGTQIIVDLINNNVAAQFFNTLVGFTPI